jgi:cell division protein FtsB
MALKWILSLSVPVLLILVLQYRLWFDDTGVVASWQLQVDDLNHSDELIEEKAREDLGFIGKDESFYLILDK